MRLHLIFLAALLVSITACTGVESLEPNEIKGETQPTLTSNTEPLPKMIAINASYCSVCKKMKPVVEKLKSQCNLDGVLVESFDVSEEKYEDLIDKYRVKSLPTYLFIDEADYEVARLVGEQSESALKQALSVLRGEECPGVGKIKGGKGS